MTKQPRQPTPPKGAHLALRPVQWDAAAPPGTIAPVGANVLVIERTEELAKMTWRQRSAAIYRAKSTTAFPLLWRKP
jgi:hypothetical protein